MVGAFFLGTQLTREVADTGTEAPIQRQAY